MNLNTINIKRTNLNDDVYSIIKNKIQLRKIKPGDHIFLRNLAKELNVSLTPIQYALGQLEVEGLVKRIPKKGVIVVGISKKDISEIIDTRLLVEKYACKIAIKSVYYKKMINKISQINDKMKIFVNKDSFVDFEKYVSLDLSFHQSIVKMSGNKKLLELYNYIELQMHIIRIFYSKFRGVNRAQELIKEHDDILMALKEKNSKKAENAIKIHLQNTKKALLKVKDIPDFL